MKNIVNKNFSSAYLSGFTQADGNFHVGFQKISNYSIGVRVTPKFSLTQHIRAKPLFEELKFNLGVGHVVTHRSDVNYVVNSLPHIKDKLLPLFDAYPLRAGKLESYMRFKYVIDMMDNKQHLNKEGLANIVNNSYLMNTASSRTEDKKQELLKLIGYEGNLKIEELILPKLPPINSDFVSGLTDGDGSFFIGFRGNGRITASYTVIQESSCKSVLEELVDYFNCGKVYDLKSKSSRFQVENLDDICNKIIPNFKNNELLTDKNTHFHLFSRACELIQNKAHKTQEGLVEIIDLAYNMNKEGKGRKLTKEEYTNLMLSKFKSSPKLIGLEELDVDLTSEVDDYTDSTSMEGNPYYHMTKDLDNFGNSEILTNLDLLDKKKS
uniref:Homing endonuclease LAGLIDADG domain-containing protein n=1 Tax=Phycomyces blakesleeanus TaxID=4837 RepID=A0A0K1HNH5_PHYBL|nr:hypothetical protein [Phycomyces blakesleeanus]AKT93720.1 hypothetical protein [Phycomyces blakesleeanus]